MFLRGCLACLGLLCLSAPAAALDLQGSVAAALAYRPDLERQGEQMAAAEAAIDAAVADYLPQIDLTASAGWRLRGADAEELIDLSDSDGLGPPVTGVGTTQGDFGFDSDWRYGATLEARQLVFDGFGTMTRIAAAEAERDGRLANYREAAELVALEAVESYLDILRTRSLVEVAEANLAAHRRLVGRVRQLGQGGQLTAADVAQAEARLALAEADLADRLGELAQAIAFFVSRTGESPDDLAPVTAPSGRPAGEAQAVAAALAEHPALAVADAAVVEGIAEGGTAAAAYWPQVDLVARASADRSIEVLGNRTAQVEGLVRLTWNLYSGGRDSALVRQAEAELAAMRYDREERRRTVEEEVRVAYRQLLTAEAVALPLQRHAEATVQVLRAYGQQFDIGRRSLLDLLDAQSELNEAQLRAVDAQYRLVLAHYELAYAMGTLTATLGLPAPVP